MKEQIKEEKNTEKSLLELILESTFQKIEQNKQFDRTITEKLKKLLESGNIKKSKMIEEALRVKSDSTS